MWDLTASACSCELVPEIGTAVRSLTVALDGTMIVAANNQGTCYVWRMMRGARDGLGCRLCLAPDEGCEGIIILIP